MSEAPRCRPGDLAVVIQSFHRANLGRIVRIVALHDGRGDLVYRDAGPVWLVRAADPMTWTQTGRRYRRRQGPVPDSQLRPIRGQGDDAGDAAGRDIPVAADTLPAGEREDCPG